jgi:predicted nuclease of predicted toxin-antitoxin system
MKFKLDENFGTRTQQIFQQRGHDVHTVLGENLKSAPDTYLYEICCHEQRCLVTLDLDFTDVVRFPPRNGSGIAVIRQPFNSPNIGKTYPSVFGHAKNNVH